MILGVKYIIDSKGCVTCVMTYDVIGEHSVSNGLRLQRIGNIQLQWAYPGRALGY